MELNGATIISPDAQWAVVYYDDWDDGWEVRDLLSYEEAERIYRHYKPCRPVVYLMQVLRLHEKG